ncbi:hypothetical protein PCK1_002921, partial [Pneumocystis canis]
QPIFTINYKDKWKKYKNFIVFYIKHFWLIFIIGQILSLMITASNKFITNTHLHLRFIPIMSKQISLSQKLAYGYTNILSCMLLNCFSIITIFVLITYNIEQILRILICFVGLIMLTISNLKTKKNHEVKDPIKGDIFMIIGSSLYGLSNILEEIFVSKQPIYEVIGQLGFWGYIYLKEKTIGFMFGYNISLFIFYSLTPILFRMSSALFYNISLLTSLIIGIYLFHYYIYWLYPFAFTFIILSLVTYHLFFKNESKKPWINYDYGEGIHGIGTYKTSENSQTQIIHKNSQNLYLDNNKSTKILFHMSTDLSVPWILYLAVQYASGPSLRTLSELILKFPNIFSKKIILNILNFVPECTEPEEYLSLVFHGKYQGEDDMDSSQISKIQNIDDITLLQKLEKLNIYKDKEESGNYITDEELYIWFVSKAKKIEEETGLISFSHKLVLTSKYPIPSKVQEWGCGIVITLESVLNRQYNNPSLKFNIPTLKQFETLNYKKAIDILLQHLGEEEILEEIKSNVTLYISYCQSLSKDNVWNSLWSWLLDFSFKQKKLNLIKLVSSSNIISANQYEFFSKYAIASCYCCKNMEKENIHSMKMILQNLKQNLNIKTNSNNSILNDIEIPSLDIFTPENIQNYINLITPNSNSLSLLEIMIKTISIINSQKGEYKITLSEAVYYRNKNSEFQISLLHKTMPQNPQIFNNFNDSDWIKLRNNIKWLHNVSLIYKNIPKIEYESFLLYNMLRTTKFSLAENIYIKTDKKSMPLKEDIVLCIIAETALSQDDFHFAYNICVNNMFSLFKTADINTTDALINIIWKSCFQISKKHEIKDESSENIKKKMYLLSKVINICPKEHLVEVLNVWRQFEKEQLSIKIPNEISDFNSNSVISYSSITKSMRIPKSLFLSASKAARTLGTTLSSTSFPFNKQKISYIVEKNITKKHPEHNKQESKSSNNKLDILADVVTQKFTSGLGWVLGVSDDQK